MKFKLDTKKIPNGAILMLSIRYPESWNTGDTRGRTEPTIYTYALLKAAGLWYMTGAGRVPTAAGWGAVERWLEKDGREVVRVEVVTGMTTIWPEPSGQPETPDDGFMTLNFSADILPDVAEIVNVAVAAGASKVVELAVRQAAEKIFRRKNQGDPVDTSQS